MDSSITTEATTRGERLFKNEKTATNMPFFDGDTLVFCQSSGTVKANIQCTGTIWKMARRNKVLAERIKNLPRSQEITYRAWKMAYCNLKDKTVHPIITGLPVNVAERSPTFYRDGDGVHLSFISGVPTSGGFYYKLYTCSGPDFDNLETPKPLSNTPLFFGFVSPHHICRGTMNVVELTERVTGHTFKLTTSFHRVASVTFPADNPSRLLISGLVNKQFKEQTVLYDLATGDASDVSVAGSVYKSSMYASQLVFAQKEGGSFENRALYQGEYALSPSTIQISKGK